MGTEGASVSMDLSISDKRRLVRHRRQMRRAPITVHVRGKCHAAVDVIDSGPFAMLSNGHVCSAENLGHALLYALGMLQLVTDRPAGVADHSGLREAVTIIAAGEAGGMLLSSAIAESRERYRSQALLDAEIDIDFYWAYYTWIATEDERMQRPVPAVWPLEHAFRRHVAMEAMPRAGAAVLAASLAIGAGCASLLALVAPEYGISSVIGAGLATGIATFVVGIRVLGGRLDTILELR